MQLIHSRIDHSLVGNSKVRQLVVYILSLAQSYRIWVLIRYKRYVSVNIDEGFIGEK